MKTARPHCAAILAPPLIDVMTKKLAAIALVLSVAGCRMCSDCCDYSSPVPGGRPMSTTRSGSNLGASAYLSEPKYVPGPTPMPAASGRPAAGATP